MDNLHIYNKYREVPKEALKDFNNGSFSGSDINTMWRIKSLTEEFGPCGIGWYFDIIRTWTENGVDSVVMCFAEIKLYVKYNGEWSKGISATGGSMLVKYFKSTGTKNNDEGYKSALTDALGVACKYLGFAANVYWENDKTKYTEDEKQDKPTPPQKEARPINNSQVSELESLKTNFEALINHYKVKKVFDLTYEQAEEALAAKRRQYA